MYWTVEITTRRKNGRIAYDRSPVVGNTELLGYQGALLLAKLMFGEDEGAFSVLRDEGKPFILGENMFDEDVTIAVVHYYSEPPYGTFGDILHMKH